MVHVFVKGIVCGSCTENVLVNVYIWTPMICLVLYVQIEVNKLVTSILAR